MGLRPGAVTQLRNMWYTLLPGMAKDVILKARVDEELAQAVDRWAQAHGADRSETIRFALRRLLEDDEARRRRLEELEERFEAYEEAGLFDPPEDDAWKAGGFR